MPPKRSSKAKQAAGLSQPQLSFQSRRPGSTPKKPKALRQSVSETSVPSDSDRSAAPLTIKDDDNELSQIEEIESEAEGSSPKPTSARNGKDVASKVGRKGPRRQLDVKSKQWAGVIKAAKVEMAGMKPIHAGPETHNDIHHVLRVFDMTSSYGPYVGISRLSRWERAKKLGLNPPEEILEILTTQQGEEDVRYRENVFYDWLG